MDRKAISRECALNLENPATRRGKGLNALGVYRVTVKPLTGPDNRAGMMETMNSAMSAAATMSML